MLKALTVGAAAVAVSAGLAGPANAASGKTFHFFSKETSSQIVDPSGQPVAGEPAAGDTLIATDDDYLGSHTKHAKKIYATDHLICTIKTVSTTQFTGLCDAEIALPGGMVIVNRETVSFGGKTVLHVNGGTGKYDGLKSGTVTSVNFSDKSDDSDLTVKVG